MKFALTPSLFCEFWAKFTNSAKNSQKFVKFKRKCGIVLVINHKHTLNLSAKERVKNDNYERKRAGKSLERK